MVKVPHGSVSPGDDVEGEAEIEFCVGVVVRLQAVSLGLDEDADEFVSALREEIAVHSQVVSGPAVFETLVCPLPGVGGPVGSGLTGDQVGTGCCQNVEEGIVGGADCSSDVCVRGWWTHRLAAGVN